MTDLTHSEGERLSKRVMALNGCSRSEAERLIGNGHVQVAGEVVTDPARRVLNQVVTVQTPATQDNLRPVTLLWHKPAGQTLKADQSPAGLLPAGEELQPWHLKHLRCLTPLPVEATGVAVFAQDPRVLQRLRETVPGLEQEWLLDVTGHVTAEQLEALRASADLLASTRSHVLCKLSVGSQSANHTRLRLALKWGDCIRLPAWLHSAGLSVERLHRARLGRLALGALPDGGWRLMASQERL
jgi:23S rRNA pseudouridine2604 synthase